jgi:ribosomal protein L37AE/L43A
MSLESRVEKLEQQTGTQSDCEMCARVETRVIVPEVDGEKWEKTDHTAKTVNCPKCNAPREIVMRVIEARQPDDVMARP